MCCQARTATGGRTPSQPICIDTDYVSLLPSPPVPAIDWAKEAARLTLYLDPELLLAPLHNRLPEATGVLMWLHGQGEGLTPLYIPPCSCILPPHRSRWSAPS